jgi:hypothetical protein
MGSERNLLYPYDHLGRDAIPFQQARCDGRPLQAEDFFPIPDAGHVNGCANALDDIGRCNQIAHLGIPNFGA